MSNNDKMGSSDDTIGTAPTVDPDTAGRGGYDLEGVPGIHVVKSIDQDSYDSYSNQSTVPKTGSD